MGHLLERALISKNGGGVLEWNKCTYATKVGREAVIAIRQTQAGKIIKIDTFGHRRTRFKTIEDLRLEISEYANENWSECLAEAVCDYITNAENAQPLSKAIWKILKRELS